MENYNEIKVDDLKLNAWKTLDKEWAIVAAGGKKRHNAMTISWGGFGIMWGRPVVTIYLRPQRYTRGFVEKKSRFSLNFMPQTKKYRDAMTYIGRVSGRDEDKMAQVGLEFNLEDKTPTIKDAELIFQCRVLYRGRIEKQNFIERDMAKEYYPEKDYHFVYIAEITEAYQAAETSGTQAAGAAGENKETGAAGESKETGETDAQA